LRKRIRKNLSEAGMQRRDGKCARAEASACAEDSRLTSKQRLHFLCEPLRLCVSAVKYSEFAMKSKDDTPSKHQRPLRVTLMGKTKTIFTPLSIKKDRREFAEAFWKVRCAEASACGQEFKIQDFKIQN
jgi:hypothetical protein